MKRWIADPPSLTPFRFPPIGVPVEVTVWHLVVEAGSDGPRPTGEALVRRYVNGVLVSEKRIEPGAAP